jgi:hypothetical protein
MEAKLQALVEEEFKQKDAEKALETMHSSLSTTAMDSYKRDDFEPSLQPRFADISPKDDTPITFFSENGTQSSNLNLPATSIDKSKQFRRNDQFSEGFSDRQW